MRKQYHFYPSDRGLQAWDVARLIDLSRDLPRQRIPVSSIREFDEVYWFDGEYQKPTCRKVIEHLQLIAKADLSHPIILGADGRVIDGMHRVAKAFLQEKETVETVRFSEDPEPDYVDVKPGDLPYD